MQAKHLLIDGGLIIRHAGGLGVADLLNYLIKLFRTHALDHAKYIVSDFSQTTEITFDESHGQQIGAVVRELRSIRITLRRPIRWAVVTADQRIGHLAEVIAVGAGPGICHRAFTNPYEAILWGKNPGIYTQLGEYLAQKIPDPGGNGVVVSSWQPS